MTKLLWTQRTNFGPTPRSSVAMADDSNRGRTVLFGGDSVAAGLELPGDTWEWDGSFWTQMQNIGANPRSQSAMDYDSARQVSVLFGGLGATPQGSGVTLGDTWQWDGEDWTQVSDSGPSARLSHSVAFDSGRNRLVLFGGQGDLSTGGILLSDTWEFDGENWTQQENTGPSPRYGHAMAYDGVGRVILFGGSREIGSPVSLGDTWAWNGPEWVQIAEFGPSARQYAAMAAGGGGNLILYGGQTNAGPGLADTWEFDGRLWTQRQDIGPEPLLWASMAFDRGRAAVVLFGGQVTSLASLSGSTWEAAIPLQSTVIVKSLSFPNEPVPGGVAVDLVQPMIVTLGGPAPQGCSTHCTESQIQHDSTF